MTDIILHHYAVSPYSEKVRIGLGLKGLAWGSVETPVIMPKPDLTALTGGYRKAPVLQIGADIYCDSQLIMRADTPPRPFIQPAAAQPTGLPGGPRRQRSAQLPASSSRRSPTRCPRDFLKTEPNSQAEISTPP
jgi:hypothetical protein